MKRAENLKEFMSHTINFLAYGYTKVLITRIPKKKLAKKNEIYSRVAKNYNAWATRSQRAYAKSKGYANFQMLVYLDLILIFHTRGEIKPEIDLGNGFVCFEQNNRLELKLSDYLGVIFFRDERNKITVRLSKETLKDFKNEIRESFKNKNGRRYNYTLNRFKGLPIYHGIIQQKKDTLKWLRENHKKFNSSWSIPRFL